MRHNSRVMLEIPAAGKKHGNEVPESSGNAMILMDFTTVCRATQIYGDMEKLGMIVIVYK